MFVNMVAKDSLFILFLGGRESAWDSRLGMREFEHLGRVNDKNRVFKYWQAS
jgi:hypothetical protein